MVLLLVAAVSLSANDHIDATLSKLEAEVHALAAADGNCCVKLFAKVFYDASRREITSMRGQIGELRLTTHSHEMCFPTESRVTLSPMCVSTDPDATRSFTRRACDYEPDACLSSRLHFKAAHTRVIEGTEGETEEGWGRGNLRYIGRGLDRFTISAKCKKIRLFDNDDDDVWGGNQDAIFGSTGAFGSTQDFTLRGASQIGPRDLVGDVSGFCVYY